MQQIIQFLTERTGSARRDLTVIALIFGTAFFQFLGKFPLMEPDEGRYSEIPREMLERGDFVTPMLNYVKYFEKPPLHYWLNAISMRIFGENEFATRLPGALCGLLTVLFIYHLARKLFGRREGLMAALVLGSATGFLVQGRINLTDMTLTFCMTVTIGCFLLASHPAEARKGLYYHLFYLFSALAFLAKGLIGIVLPGGVIFLYLLFCKRWSLLREMRLFTGMILLLAVAAPWPLLASLRNPEFFNFFFIHEHFTRFLTKVHGRYQPFWFFVPILLLTMLPWSFFVPQALVRAWRERKSPGGDRILYLIIWAAFIFLFFSKSNSKLIPYILPVFPPLAVLVGLLFGKCFDGEALPKKTAITLAVVLCIAGCGAIAYPFVDKKPYASAAGGAALGIVFIAEGALAIVMARRGDAKRLFCVLVAGGLLLSLVAPHAVFPAMSGKKASSRELCRMVRSVAGPDSAVVSVGYEQGFPFYAGRRVIIAGGMGELEFGAKIGDQSAWFMERENLPSLWDSGRHVVALIKPNDLESLKANIKTPVRVLGQDSRKLLIANR
ncbi:undecaprenyl phosphate-alpha-4-amino-4-deoxy-L-arabinose arabinosyl transferase 1 [Geobacter sp. OR-1]|uniref:glycosyltransferase family 39 protein n=1 Tax=Geobacter sp. OR-1 TaxID=1266765 RepID=UPI000541D591|nr:glycosyltransferase family 39 protein [Geobacter sp. OR-1]GAM09763.1 undecaprenyl phosphate-alpha-4-amino-4-deoxy-L-arabinose arabinosyl transferase 1 [Geobacter sp. OR-1]